VELQAAVLCDTAAVRDGLVTIVNGGIDRWGPPEYPAPLPVTFAGILEVDERAEAREHQLAVVVVDEELEELGRAHASFSLQGTFEFGDTAKLPIAIPLAGITVPNYGDYEVRIIVDDDILIRLPLRAMAV
jgi:hypothetical protein